MKNSCKKENGITLMSLVITIVILLILASIATYSGIEVIKSSKLTKFTTEMRIMQTQVNELYQKMKDEYFGFDFDRMKPVSDAENKYFGYMVPVVSLQKGVQQGRLNDRKELIDRIDRLEEDSNPVLFLYKSKK